jgi:hypothetical protein
LLFGPFYFAIKGIWSHAIISFVLACATVGISWLIYPFWAKRIVEASYLRRGWQRADATPPSSIGTANTGFKLGYRFAQHPVRWLLVAAAIVLVISIFGHERQSTRTSASPAPATANQTTSAATKPEAEQSATVTPTVKSASGKSVSALSEPVTFRGIALAQPLSIPKCNQSIHQPTCWVQTNPQNCPGKIVVRLSEQEGNAFPTQLAVNICIYVINGKVAEISQTTLGIEHQDQVLDALQAKFGKPTAITTSKVQNRMGARFDVIDAEWNLHDLEVEFTGATTDLNYGEISITTPEFRAYAREHIKPKPGL